MSDSEDLGTDAASTHAHQVRATITAVDPEYLDGQPDDVVVFIDTADWTPGRRLRIRLNDGVIYEGDPERENYIDVASHVATTYYGRGGLVL